jgi:hypothetical protein
MTAHTPIRDLSIAICAVCQRPGCGYAYTPDGTRPKWLCDDPDCFILASAVIDMPSSEARKAAVEARIKGGEAAGAYLEKIGKTDLADMTREEWLDFLLTYDNARSDFLKRQAAEWAPPF